MKKSSKPETKDDEEESSSSESPFLLRLMFTFLHTVLTKIETSSERYVVVRFKISLKHSKSLPIDIHHNISLMFCSMISSHSLTTYEKIAGSDATIRVLDSKIGVFVDISLRIVSVLIGVAVHSDHHILSVLHTFVS